MRNATQDFEVSDDKIQDPQPKEVQEVIEIDKTNEKLKEYGKRCSRLPRMKLRNLEDRERSSLGATPGVSLYFRI